MCDRSFSPLTFMSETIQRTLRNDDFILRMQSSSALNEENMLSGENSQIEISIASAHDDDSIPARTNSMPKPIPPGERSVAKRIRKRAAGKRLESNVKIQKIDHHCDSVVSAGARIILNKIEACEDIIVQHESKITENLATTNKIIETTSSHDEKITDHESRLASLLTLLTESNEKIALVEEKQATSISDMEKKLESELLIHLEKHLIMSQATTALAKEVQKTSKNIESVEKQIQDQLLVHENKLGITAQAICTLAKKLEKIENESSNVPASYLKQKSLPLDAEVMKSYGIIFNEANKHHPHWFISLFENYTNGVNIEESQKCILFRSVIDMPDNWKNFHLHVKDYSLLKRDFLDEYWSYVEQREALEYFRRKVTEADNTRTLAMIFLKWYKTLQEIDELTDKSTINTMYNKLPIQLQAKISEEDKKDIDSFRKRIEEFQKIRENSEIDKVIHFTKKKSNENQEKIFSLDKIDSDLKIKNTSSKFPTGDLEMQALDEFKEFEFIGDGLAHYFKRCEIGRKDNLPKYLRDQLSLEKLHAELENVTFKKKKVIISLGQLEINYSKKPFETIEEDLRQVIDRLCRKGIEKIIVLFPVIKPRKKDEKPVSLKRYIAFRRMFAKLAQDDRVIIWRNPSQKLLKCEEVINDSGEPYERPCADENFHLIPDVSKFNYSEIKQKYFVATKTYKVISESLHQELKKLREIAHKPRAKGPLKQLYETAPTKTVSNEQKLATPKILNELNEKSSSTFSPTSIMKRPENSGATKLKLVDSKTLKKSDLCKIEYTAEESEYETSKSDFDTASEDESVLTGADTISAVNNSSVKNEKIIQISKNETGVKSTKNPAYAVPSRLRSEKQIIVFRASTGALPKPPLQDASKDSTYQHEDDRGIPRQVANKSPVDNTAVRISRLKEFEALRQKFKKKNSPEQLEQLDKYIERAAANNHRYEEIKIQATSHLAKRKKKFEKSSVHDDQENHPRSPRTRKIQLPLAMLKFVDEDEKIHIAKAYENDYEDSI